MRALRPMPTVGDRRRVIEGIEPLLAPRRAARAGRHGRCRIHGSRRHLSHAQVHTERSHEAVRSANPEDARATRRMKLAAGERCSAHLCDQDEGASNSDDFRSSCWTPRSDTLRLCSLPLLPCTRHHLWSACRYTATCQNWHPPSVCFRAADRTRTGRADECYRVCRAHL